MLISPPKAPLALFLALAAISAVAITVWTPTPPQRAHPGSSSWPTPEQPTAAVARIESSDASGPTATSGYAQPGTPSAVPDATTPASLDPNTIDFLAMALAEPALAPIALNLLSTTDPGEARERISAWIEELETDNPRPYLDAYLATREWTVRRAVGSVLQRSADTHAINELVRSWHGAVNDHERAQVENLIIGITSPAAEEAVIVALLDPARSSDLGVRRALMLGLGSIGGRIGVSALIEWLRSQPNTGGPDGSLLASAVCAVRSEEGQLILGAVAENASGHEPLALRQHAVVGLFSQPSAVAVAAFDRLVRIDDPQLDREKMARLKQTMLAMIGP